MVQNTKESNNTNTHMWARNTDNNKNTVITRKKKKSKESGKKTASTVVNSYLSQVGITKYSLDVVNFRVLS